MITIANVRHTFLHFLADNISGVNVHPIRRDVRRPGSDILELNAINVEFLGVDIDTGISDQQVVISIVFDDDSSAVECLEAVVSLLTGEFYTPLLDYESDIDDPLSLDGNVIWDRGKVSFRKIYADEYVHYSCTLPLRFHSI